MSFRDTSADLNEFLDGINLGQYFSNFQAFGYNSLQDCMWVNNAMLQQMGICPTGHRRRILKHLEVLFSKRQGKSADIESHSSDPPVLNLNESGIKGTISSEQTDTVCGNSCACEENQELPDNESQELTGSTSSDLDSFYSSCPNSHCSTDVSAAAENTLEQVTPETVSYIDDSLEKGQSSQVEDAANDDSTSDAFCSSEMKSGEEEHLLCSGLGSLPRDPPDSPFTEFKGEMVENDLYGPCAQSLLTAAPRITRSFILRHRPVPEIPGSSKAAASPSSLQERRNLNTLSIPSLESLLSQNSDSAEEKPPPISPYGETFLFDSTEDSEIWDNELSTFQEKDRDERGAERDPPPNKTCTPLIWKINEEIVDSKLVPVEDKYALPNKFAGEPEYSTVKDCARYARRGKYKPSKTNKELKTGTLDFTAVLHISSTQSGGVIDGFADVPVPSPRDSITPYACFYGSSMKKVKEGWLDKLSPQGKHMFQKRWVKFDGDSISYYNNEKEVYSKGIILLSAVSSVRVHGDIKFELVTAHRIFVFRAEKEDERNDWINTILGTLQLPPEASRTRSIATPPEKSGYLELKGYKAKIFTLLQGSHVWICKSEQDFRTGYGITVIPMNVANVRQVDRTSKQSFEIITPYRSFSFTTESEKEKQEWIEALQQSIAETLSDYEVAEKIWFNESNRTCADCRAPDPDWASINLCVVICKKCAGQHRSLGPRDSKVRSLKMDASIWSNELIELFIVIGNKRANSFWEGNLQSNEELPMDAPTDRRLTFITQKYKEGRFRKTTLLYKTKEELNKALCAAVVKQDILETMTLLFSGADVMCATGDPVYSTPYLLAKRAGQRLQMEFLHHNKFSDFPNSVSSQDSSSTFLCEYLYKLSFNAPKLLTERKLKEECNKRWCALESGFLSYYENEKTTSPNGMIDISEVICLVIHKVDSFLHAGAIFTFEIYLLSERVFLFGAEAADSQRKWTQAIAKHFVSDMARPLLGRDYDVIGQLYYKDCHDLDNWKKGWFAIEKSNLHFCLDLEDAQEDLIHLRRLQELTISSIIQNGEKIDVLLLVEKGRTLYIHGHTKLDFTVWRGAIEKAAGTDGNVLEDQQLSKNDVPIIVNSCIAFVTQYGLSSKHIYLNSGDPAHVSDLLECFKKDARSVKLRAGTNRLEDVTETLKCFLFEIDDALLTKQLYPFWITALDTVDDKERVRKYSTFIRTLPPVNRATLAALMEHLYRVQKCSEINHMDPHNLAMAFSSCLFQTKGQTSEEVNVIEDLIINYVHLFDVHEEQVKQMDIENSFITKWNDTPVSQAGDLLVEVYVERKEPDCSVIVRVSPMMEAEELTTDVLEIKSITPHRDDRWTAFEVIENGELERLLHYTENVLEQILHWSSLPDPSSACLIIKKFPSADTGRLHSEKNAEGCVKAGYLKYKEEPSKLLSGNKFQERYFVLREGNLFLYKDTKSVKPEKVLPVKSLKLYLGVKKKMKPPTNWGLTLCSEKHHWYLCCDGQDCQLEWLSSLFIAQHSNIWPPDGKIRKRSTRNNPRIGGLSLIPIQHERSPPETKASDLENSKVEPGGELAEDKKGLKQKASLVAQCLERNEDKARSRERKYRSLIFLEDAGENVVDWPQNPAKESPSPKRSENRASQMPLESAKQFPADVIQELSTILQKHKSVHRET
ncbi:PREDICTED: arf-GAP with Rho-GAP domain, ANK repeat and PH domain-containing protein 2 [Gekko japonicus]|uniref:Arf-GAP with Rho-GAP domain, ANK repeat and PH domain-containing protein 2 n=1 Tax=Gekko japonicus TaxID=146911 RepID=A0ABM1KIZ3_GEKJA|nr:PREDICTED: arf-GAP with Rho-GAP domain, ANK repeat and PH domain-containing protein 2 [Gekko japonicus]